MLVKIVSNGRPHRVQDEVDSLTTGKLGCWNKIAIASHQDNLIDLALEGHGRNI